jgi:DNA-directed RNA polymerase
MSTIELQIELEHELLQKTKKRFEDNTTTASVNGRGSETDHARRLYKLFIEDLSSDIAEMITLKSGKPGAGNKYYALLKSIDTELVAGIALNELFDNVFQEKRGLQDALINIGMRIEDEIKFTKFKSEHPEYFDVVIRDFKTKGTTNYRHMHRVLTNKMHEFNVVWNDWSSLERVNVGQIIAKVVIDTTGLFKIKKAVQRGKRSEMTTLEFTEDTEEWLSKFSEFAQFLRPLGAPCIIPPKNWESMHHGGFYSPEMQTKFPFVRSRHLKQLIGADLSRHMQAVNKLQATAWQINPEVNHFFSWAMQNNITSLIGLPSSQPFLFPESPVAHLDKDALSGQQEEEFLNWKRETARLHTKERKRHADALALWRISHMANEYKVYDQFYFVYTTDFRGRIYPVTSGLSPQGADYSKGLLKFQEGKEIGVDGAYWFTVHGSNLLGFDKSTYDERVEYINEPERIAAIKRVRDNLCSIETAKFIGSADKPLQFLAWCLEFAEFLEVGTTFVSHIPVGLDGSCNGLQNFSAVLRDTVGGIATNVLPSARPNDIYGEVARVAVGKLHKVTDDLVSSASKLLLLGIDRKTTKRSVMTLPYGLSKHSSGQYIGDWLYDNHMQHYPSYSEFNKAKNLLNDVVWEAIGEVVKAAREGMDWLQEVAKIVGTTDQPLIWTTPTGFRVYQKNCQSKVRRVRSALAGVKSYNIREFTDAIDKKALRNGSAPNYIHGMDAAHLVLTVLESSGITSWQMIHDDFGTHACDIPELHRAIRVAFFKMYDDIDRLAIFSEEISRTIDVDLPMQPAMGSMDISDVLDSEYFFG